MSANHHDLELEELVRRATDRLLMEEVMDVEAFELLYDHIAAKAQKLRNQSALSKQILGSIRGAAESIRSRSEYLAEVRKHRDLAGKFDMLLDLLIASEDPAEKLAGQPRII